MKPLSVIITGNADPLAKEFTRAEMLSKKFAVHAQHQIVSAGSGVLHATRAAQVANEIAIQRGVASGFVTGGIYSGKGGVAGKRPNFAIAGSMFTSVARDTAASLASGAPITQVIAQQAPQVLQALSMMRLGMVALRFSMVGAAVGGVLYMANAWRKWYFEVDRTTRLTERIKVMTDSISKWRDVSRQRMSNEADNAVAAFNRNRQALEQQASMADAEMELEKERIKAHSYQTQKMRDLETEKKLQAELLAVELKRAQTQLEEAKAKPANSALLAAEAKLADVVTKGERQAADDAAKTDWRTSTLKPEQMREALHQQWLHSLDYANDLDNANRDLEAAKKVNNQKEITDAETKVLSLQNQIEELTNIKTDAGSKTTAQLHRGIPDVTDRQRMNLWAVGNSPLLDVNRSMERHLRSIDMKMGRNSIDESFGSSPQ